MLEYSPLNSHSVVETLKNLKSCPICGSTKINKSYSSHCQRKPNSDERWDVYNCADCQHGFINPQPSWDELSAYYSEDYDPYMRSHGSDTKNDEKDIEEAKLTGSIRHIPIPTNQSLLDVGSGAGRFIRLAKKLGAEVQGVEPSGVAVSKARADGLEVFEGMLDDYITQVGDAKKFDVITSNHVVEHAPDPVATLRQMKQLLAEDGTIWISVPNANCWSFQKLGADWHSVDIPYHIQQFSTESILKAGESAGLKPVRTYTHTVPSALAASLRMIARKKYFLPRKISMRLSLFDRYASTLAKRLDQQNAGEAIIVEFKV